MDIRKPAWLDALDTQKFFVGCPVHENARKNEKNICCLDCCTAICPHCLPSHRLHRFVQVRRYVYHDVVQLQDLEKLIDCSNVQSYTINSSKVIFIKKRPQSKQFKGTGNTCSSCDRILQEPYIHCSLECKVEYVLRQKKDLSAYLRPCESLQMNPDFVIPHIINTSSREDETSHSTIVEGNEPMGSSDSETMSMQQCTNYVGKKWSGLNLCSRSASRISNKVDMAANMNRRKGIPHRSHLY